MKIRPPRATISDVAHAARTGKTSVSRYLNGELHLLSADLKTRIEQAIADLNYRPSQMARGLKRGRTRLIGLIIADITNPYSVDVMSGIEAACREQGFTLLMCNTNNEVDLEQHYLQLLSSYQVEGIVVNAVGMREEVLSHLQQSLLPMVLIDRKIPDFPCDVVGLNNAEAAETVTRHLVDNGYQALLFLSEPLGSVNTRRERLQAFRQVLAAYPQVEHENMELALHQPAALDQALRAFHQRHAGKRSAVIVANGALTLQVARSLQRINLHWGRFICQQLEKEGIDHRQVTVDNRYPTGFQLKSKVDDGSDPLVEYFRKGSAASHLSVEDFNADYFGSARHLHLSGVAAAICDSSLALLKHAAKEMRARF